VSLLSAALIRTVAVVVVLPVAAAASAADRADTPLSRDEAGPRPPEARATPGLVPLARVRIETVPPSNVRAQLVQEDSHSVVLQAESSGERFTLSKAGRTIEGRVASVDDGFVTLLIKGQTVRVRRRDVVRLQVPGEKSPILAVAGGLVGAYAGMWIAPGLLKATGVEGDDAIWLWLGVVAASAGIGGAALGNGGWRTVALPPSDRVSLALRPTRGGAAAGLSVTF
jgi:hypothetical protein